MKFVDLKNHLNSGELKPCYLVMGDDAGVRAIAKRLFCNLVKAFPEMNVTHYDNRADAAQIASACRSLPFMSEYRLVVVSDYNQSTAEIAQYLTDPSPTTILVFVLDSVNQFLKPITKTAEVVDCKRLDHAILVKYCAKLAKDNGVAITLKATELLISYCNSYLSSIETEIRKLSCDGDVINEEMIIEKVNPDQEVVTFGLMDRIIEKNKAKTMQYLDDLLAGGQSPFALLGALYAQYRKLFYVSINKGSDTLAADLGVPSYTLKYALASAAHYTPATLKKICTAIADADYAVKSGRMTDKNALYTTVVLISELTR